MVRRLAALMSGILLLGLACAPPASASDAPISFWVRAAASLSGDGTTINLAFDYRCPRKYGGSRGYGIVSSTQVTQRLGHGQRAIGADTGGSGVDLVCDGRWRHGRHTVTAQDLGYRAGAAFLSTSLLFCDRTEIHCVDLTKKRTVQLVRQ